VHPFLHIAPVSLGASLLAGGFAYPYGPFIHIGPVTLGTYGVMVASALICAFFVMRADLARRRIHADAESIIGITGLAGLVGARLYHLLESPSVFFAHPLPLLFSTMGFAWFGALIGGFLALVWLARHYRMNMLLLLDVAAPAAALGYGVGRIGCLLSGDGDYGTPTSLPWGMSFPHGLEPTTQYVHPTPIYELIVAVGIACVLWRIGRRGVHGAQPPGEVFAVYLILTGVARFLVEFIRINPRSFLGLTNAQAASILSVVAGLLLWVALSRRFPAAEAQRRQRVHQR
jgi:phosphatidylglycerol---prolipoprotein diacylglyceryl transferase